MNRMMAVCPVWLIAVVTIMLSPGRTAAETVTIANPGYFEAPIRDGCPVFPDSLRFDSDAETLIFPDMGTFVRLGDYNFPRLRKVEIGNIDYMPGGSFEGLPALEEVIVNGRVGHFDCTFAMRCPRLRKIHFRGPVSSTGGPVFVYQCENIDSVIFDGPVCDFGLDLFPASVPELKRYILRGPVLSALNDSVSPTTGLSDIKCDAGTRSDLEGVALWQAQVLTAQGDNRWMRKIAYDDARILHPVLVHLGSSIADTLENAMQYAWMLGDDVKSDLDILKDSPLYARDTARSDCFSYAVPTDSMLKLSRERFNLDSVAGDGDDISRIRNLTYWVHNSIRHDGGNGLPSGGLNLRNIHDSALRDSCGYNCRALAIALTEALLAEGIPARYLTCESKKWDTDDDCHVITIAWSETLGKWIWADPTFAAFVTDENGLLLHPGEVRYRLQHDLPLLLNHDANWNNETEETKEEYLDRYMAKNLYILSCNQLNQPEPEGASGRHQGKFVALVPTGSNYCNANIITTDDAWFWQAPVRQLPSVLP